MSRSAQRANFWGPLLQRILLAAVGGSLVGSVTYDAVSFLFYLFGGLIFSSTVLLPSLPKWAWRWWRITGLSMVSVFSYWAAIEIYLDLMPSPFATEHSGLDFFAFPISGLAGSSIVMIGLLVMGPVFRRWHLLALLPAAGFLGGWVFNSVLFNIEEDLVVFMVGHSAWQSLVAAALYFSRNAAQDVEV